jgi:hypothetical protein
MRGVSESSRPEGVLTALGVNSRRREYTLGGPGFLVSPTPSGDNRCAAMEFVAHRRAKTHPGASGD